MRNWQRAPGTVALFVKKHQNNWRITLDFKSRWQLQDNYPKWYNCHGFSVCGSTYVRSVHATFSSRHKENRSAHCQRKFYRRKHLYALSHPHTASNQSISEKWSSRACLSPSGPPPFLALITLKCAALSYSTLPLCGFQSKHRPWIPLFLDDVS